MVWYSSCSGWLFVWGLECGLGCGLGRDLVFLVVCCFVFVWWWAYCGWLTLGGWLLDLVVCYCYVLVDAQFVTLVDVLVGFMFGFDCWCFWFTF